MSENTFCDLMTKVSDMAVTENGAVVHSVNSLEDFSRWMYLLSECRHDVTEIRDNMYDKKSVFCRYSIFPDHALVGDIASHVTDENMENVARFLCYIRDPRSGVGERAIFRSVLFRLLRDGIFKPSNIGNCVDAIVKHGRWDDVVAITACLDASSTVRNAFLHKICEQFKSDIARNLNGESVSLLAKWLPSINTSSPTSCAFARVIARKMGFSEKIYRKTVASLREKIGVVERDICSGDFDRIDYEKVPSLAMKIYRNVFTEKDRDRFTTYINDVSSGKKKINASVVTPPEIVAELSRTIPVNFCLYDDEDERVKSARILEEQWNALRDVSVSGNVLPVIDVSGSMFDFITSSIRSLDVSLGMGLFLAEHNTGAFKDLAIFFGHESKVFKLDSSKSIAYRLSYINTKVPTGFSTNVVSALRTVLNIAIESKCKQSDIPTLVFITDGEFDELNCGRCGTNRHFKTLFDEIGDEFKENGYELPKVVFWNTSNRSSSVPMRDNKNGLILLSGFSQNVLKMVMGGELDPTKAILKEISNEEFDDAKNLCS